jgi:tetratricopeptide (TPR) repeat protein
MMAEAHGDHDHDHDKEPHGESIYGKPHDIIERLGRNFYPTLHTHLDQPGEAREIMPWLKLSAELDPQKLTTYVAASYWLRQDPKHADEAEGFLRQGLRVNPDSYEILLELGKFYAQNKKDPERARNVWELGWAKFQKQKAAGKKLDDLAGSEILGELLRQARTSGDVQRQIQYLELLKQVEPDEVKPALQQQIDALKRGGK